MGESRSPVQINNIRLRPLTRGRGNRFVQVLLNKIEAARGGGGSTNTHLSSIKMSDFNSDLA